MIDECNQNRGDRKPLTLSVAKDQHVDHCLALTAGILDIEFPKEYVARGELLTLMDHENEICGGAILVSQPPFRSLCSIPKTTTTWRSLDQSAMLEVNGVWLSEQKSSPFLSYSFWTLLLRSLLASASREYLFTFDNSNDRMAAVAKWLRPIILYSGQTTKMSGMKKQADETIALVQRDTIKLILKIIDDANASRRDGAVKSFINQRVSKRNAA